MKSSVFVGDRVRFKSRIFGGISVGTIINTSYPREYLLRVKGIWPGKLIVRRSDVIEKVHNWRGDTGLFRQALDKAGFEYSARHDQIFNDVRKDSNTRRLKLWGGNIVQQASLEQQWKLYDALKAVYGKRMLSTYFSKTYYGGFSLCVVLKV